MKQLPRVLILMAFAVQGFPAGVRGASADEAERPVITVLVYNYAGVPAEELARARERVSRIYQKAGVATRWIDARTEAPYVDFDPGANRFRTFAVQMIIRPQLVGSALGVVHGEAGETGGMAFVSFDRVLQEAREHDLKVSDLLGYVMAHEMGHLLLPSPSHTRQGIMRGDWDGGDLTHVATGVMLFMTAEARLLRSRAATCCR